MSRGLVTAHNCLVAAIEQSSCCWTVLRRNRPLPAPFQSPGSHAIVFSPPSRKRSDAFPVISTVPTERYRTTISTANPQSDSPKKRLRVWNCFDKPDLLSGYRMSDLRYFGVIYRCRGWVAAMLTTRFLAKFRPARCPVPGLPACTANTGHTGRPDTAGTPQRCLSGTPAPVRRGS